jgi:hypothetical protein
MRGLFCIVVKNTDIHCGKLPSSKKENTFWFLLQNIINLICYWVRYSLSLHIIFIYQWALTLRLWTFLLLHSFQTKLTLPVCTRLILDSANLSLFTKAVLFIGECFDTWKADNHFPVNFAYISITFHYFSFKQEQKRYLHYNYFRYFH